MVQRKCKRRRYISNHKNMEEFNSPIVSHLRFFNPEKFLKYDDRKEAKNREKSDKAICMSNGIIFKSKRHYLRLSNSLHLHSNERKNITGI